MESESVDLIYLDPPFNSNKAYNVIYPDDLGQVTAFEDTWCWNHQCDEYIAELCEKSGGGAKHIRSSKGPCFRIRKNTDMRLFSKHGGSYY